MVRAGELPPRPGIARIVDEARAAGWQLAVCSTSAEPSVRAILENAVGVEAAADFLVLAGDVVAAKKPAPDIYLLALERLGIEPGECVVVEDSRNGLLAAVGAGLTTVVTVNGYTRDQDFSEAALVVSSLGDPDRRPSRSWRTGPMCSRVHSSCCPTFKRASAMLNQLTPDSSHLAPIDRSSRHDRTVLQRRTESDPLRRARVQRSPRLQGV